MQSLLSDPLLTVDEVGRELVRSKATIFKLLKSGAIKSVKIGQARRVRRSDLEAYIASLPVVPGGTSRADPDPGSADSCAPRTT